MIESRKAYHLSQNFLLPLSASPWLSGKGWHVQKWEWWPWISLWNGAELGPTPGSQSDLPMLASSAFAVLFPPATYESCAGIALQLICNVAQPWRCAACKPSAVQAVLVLFFILFAILCMVVWHTLWLFPEDGGMESAWRVESWW